MNCMSSDRASGTALGRFGFRPAKIVQGRRLYTTFMDSSVDV